MILKKEILPFEPRQQGHSRTTPSPFVSWAELMQNPSAWLLNLSQLMQTKGNQLLGNSEL
jgi:hypothetical protein